MATNDVVSPTATAAIATMALPVASHVQEQVLAKASANLETLQSNSKLSQISSSLKTSGKYKDIAAGDKLKNVPASQMSGKEMADAYKARLVERGKQSSYQRTEPQKANIKPVSLEGRRAAASKGVSDMKDKMNNRGCYKKETSKAKNTSNNDKAIVSGKGAANCKK
ncbi:hypothetical protein [Geotalea sp. SG265]|uniref:hypothetical protein n=1 Tax=Geotalea sp. SG265 TaxID=2922867 RepID=UPI001FAEC136|nr:hypothetical protein [Geotalea sp. SG265]